MSSFIRLQQDFHAPAQGALFVVCVSVKPHGFAFALGEDAFRSDAEREQVIPYRIGTPQRQALIELRRPEIVGVTDEPNGERLVPHQTGTQGIRVFFSLLIHIGAVVIEPEMQRDLFARPQVA